MTDSKPPEAITSNPITCPHGAPYGTCLMCYHDLVGEQQSEIERLEARWRAEGDAYIDAKDEIERLQKLVAAHKGISDGKSDVIRQLETDNSPSAHETSDCAWLIEMAGERSEPLYWHAEPDMRCLGGFDPDVNKAMRFCREKDARAMALMLSAKGMIALTDVRRVRITEHEWSSTKAEGDEP